MKLKYLLKFVLIFIGLIALYLLAAVVFPLISVNTKASKGDVTIYILTNGVHTDIVCPVVSDQIDWTSVVSYEDVRTPANYKYVTFGWGDKGFYLDTPEWKDLKFSTAFNAAFWLGDAAMHTTFYQSMEESESCKELKITEEDYSKLITYIKSSFELDSTGKVKLIQTDAVYGNTDAFYDANGSYSLFYSCNTWANDALKVANQRAALWTVTQQGIFRHY